MSSEVQAKGMNSAAAEISALPAKRSRSQYSTAFTSWLVVASIDLMRSASASENSRAARSSSARVAAENGSSDSNVFSSARARSHATSTATRSRMRANSLKWSCSARVLAA